jgi:hypothetical protein
MNFQQHLNDPFLNPLVSTTPASQWFMRRFFSLPRFAHHPTCACFNHHLLRIGSTSFCLGCTCIGFGILICLATLAAILWSHANLFQTLNPWTGILLGVILTGPTFGQPFCQRKWFKILSRSLLGAGFAILWLSAMALLPWNANGLILRGVFVLVFLLFFKLALRYRNVFTPNTVCQCVQNAYPYCPENRKRNERLFQRFKDIAGEEDLALMPVMEAMSKMSMFGEKKEQGNNIITVTKDIPGI